METEKANRRHKKNLPVQAPGGLRRKEIPFDKD